MNTNINQQTAATYLKDIASAGMGGYATLLRDLAEIKTACTSPMLWVGIRSCSQEVLDLLDHYVSVAEAVAKDITDDNEILKKK